MIDVERVKDLLAKYPGVWKAAVDTIDDLHWDPMESVTFTSPDGQQTYVLGTDSLGRFELAAAAINLLPVLLEIADLSLIKYEALGAAMGTDGMDGVVQGHHDATQAILDLNVAVKAWKKIREDGDWRAGARAFWSSPETQERMVEARRRLADGRQEGDDIDALRQEMLGGESC